MDSIAGEEKLATTFGSSYVHDDKFNKWYYCCSSVAGLLPTQNPTKAVNLDIKGNRNRTGLVKLGTSTTQVLNTELPHMANVHSTEKVGVSRIYSIANIGNAINEEVIEYYNSFDPDIDSVEYADGFLFNTELAFQEAIDGK
jgi:hypothetical protein